MEKTFVKIELTRKELGQTISALTFSKTYWEKRGIKMPFTTKVLLKFLKKYEELKNSPF